MSAEHPGEYRELIGEYVKEHEGVTFVELEKLLSEHMDVDGTHALHYDDDPKINYWFNMSEEFTDAIVDAIDEVMYMHPTTPFPYTIDGKVPDADIVRQPPEGGYKTERWMPVTFNSYPPEWHGDSEDTDE